MTTLFPLSKVSCLLRHTFSPAATLYPSLLEHLWTSESPLFTHLCLPCHHDYLLQDPTRWYHHHVGLYFVFLVSIIFSYIPWPTHMAYHVTTQVFHLWMSVPSISFWMSCPPLPALVFYSCDFPFHQEHQFIDPIMYFYSSQLSSHVTLSSLFFMVLPSKYFPTHVLNSLFSLHAFFPVKT